MSGYSSRPQGLEKLGVLKPNFRNLRQKRFSNLALLGNCLPREDDVRGLAIWRRITVLDRSWIGWVDREAFASLRAGSSQTGLCLLKPT